jgi:hypothetical protein
MRFQYGTKRHARNAGEPSSTSTRKTDPGNASDVMTPRRRSNTVARPMTPLREAKVRNETMIRQLHAHAVENFGGMYKLTMCEEDLLRAARRQRATLDRITAGKR